MKKFLIIALIFNILISCTPQELDSSSGNNPTKIYSDTGDQNDKDAPPPTT